MFGGNSHATINELPAINARYFRLYAKEWMRNVCTQMELYGCQGTTYIYDDHDNEKNN